MTIEINTYYRCSLIILACVVWAGAGCQREPSGSSFPKEHVEADSVSEHEKEDAATAIKVALRRGDFGSAERLLKRTLVSRPKDPVLLSLAGDLASRKGDSDGAVKLYEAALRESDRADVELYDKLGQAWMNLGRPFESIRVMERAIADYPDLAGFRLRLVGLQAALGLEFESRDQLQWLVQRGHGNLDLLIILSDLSRPQTVESTCEYALKSYPEDLRPQYSLARLPSYHSEWKRVVELLRPVTERHPEFVPAYAWYGRALAELGMDEPLEKWKKSLPPGIENHPQYWLSMGRVLTDQSGKLPMAAKAYQRAVLLDENNGESLQSLAASLSQLGRGDEAKRVARRASQLTSVRDQVDSLLASKKNSQAAAVTIAAEMERLGRRWEATTWLQAAGRMNQNIASSLDADYKRVRGQLTGSTPWQLPAELAAAQLDLSDFPEPQWPEGRINGSGDVASELSGPNVAIRFADQASQRKLNHTCRVRERRGNEGLQIYQSGAGGVGAIDFDLDGWPDLYLSNMNGTPMQMDSDFNRLFRNVEGEFVDVTVESTAIDRGFTQGVTIGDYNSDGFPDLLVANIGRNRLLKNNGDGTFSDVTRAAGLIGEDWTTSVAMADLDGDGALDLFQLGYCATDKALSQPCVDAEIQQTRSCAPLAFSAQADAVWRGGRDGTFADVTDTWLGEHESGRGMGLVVGALDDRPGLDVLVANDMTANHYWTRADDAVRRTSDAIESAQQRFQFFEQAGVRGLAVNARSVSQASMGIAADDADRDGDVDFLLTHFSGDYNTLYDQISVGMWSDRSQKAGLIEPSDRMLGYGTQWFDADNDGSPELFVANGDIDDFTHEGRLFEQPSQLFDSDSSGRWRELNADALGEYFRDDHLGRAVAILDANDDGKTDLVVTHLFEPVALLINETPSDAERCRFFLVGTRSQRDAIGAKVEIQHEGISDFGWIFSGDGYHCSNQRCVTFGLGATPDRREVFVAWPDGTRESFGHAQLSGDYLLVQGSGELTSLSRGPSVVR